MQESQSNQSLPITLIAITNILIFFLSIFLYSLIGDVVSSGFLAVALIALIPAVVGVIVLLVKKPLGRTIYLVLSAISFLAAVVLSTMSMSGDVTEILSILMIPFVNIVLSLLVLYLTQPSAEEKLVKENQKEQKVAERLKAKDLQREQRLIERESKRGVERKGTNYNLIKYMLLGILSLFIVSIVVPFYSGDVEIMGVTFSASVAIIEIENALLYSILIILPILSLFLVSMFVKIKKDILGMLEILMLVVYATVFYILTDFNFSAAGAGLFIYIAAYLALIATTVLSFMLNDVSKIAVQTTDPSKINL
ncbi:MAG: hypothetical protein AB7S44_01430 [Spirochaetales bacterium]